MNRKMLVIGSAAAVLLSGAAATATSPTGPILQGTYLITYVDTCQATLQNATSGGGVNTVNNGSISSTVGTATFTPKTSGGSSGKALIVGQETIGSLVLVQGEGGSAMQFGPFHFEPNYAVGTNSFTYDGTKLWANFSPTTGVAASAVFGGMDSVGCAVTGTLQQVT
jgi:hypothetical protein